MTTTTTTPDLDTCDATTWLTHHGIVIDPTGHATLFKAVNNNWQASRGTRWTYAPGTTVTADDYQPTRECGHGLHLGATPWRARAYHTNATKFVAVSVDVAELIPLGDKAKVKQVKVLHEVDATGAPMSSRISPVLAGYWARLADRWDDGDHALLPYAARISHTDSDGQDGARKALARQVLLTDLLPAWLHLAGMDDQIPALSAVSAGTDAQVRTALYKVSDQAWDKRNASLESLRAKVREALANRPVADAVADADADAAAAAVAVAVAAAAGGGYWAQRDAAYKAARQYYRDHPLAISAQVRDLAATQRASGLSLLVAMIDPSAVQA